MTCSTVRFLNLQVTFHRWSVVLTSNWISFCITWELSRPMSEHSNSSSIFSYLNRCQTMWNTSAEKNPSFSINLHFDEQQYRFNSKMTERIETLATNHSTSVPIPVRYCIHRALWLSTHRSHMWRSCLWWTQSMHYANIHTMTSEHMHIEQLDLGECLFIDDSLSIFSCELSYSNPFVFITSFKFVYLNKKL
jgi:hypothetical protein